MRWELTLAAGLMMSARFNSLDPGLVAFPGCNEHTAGTQCDRITHHESGLLGVSAISSDTRDLRAPEAADIRAAEAVAHFCYRARR